MKPVTKQIFQPWMDDIICTNGIGKTSQRTIGI